jgi:hypothetical protein
MTCTEPHYVRGDAVTNVRNEFQQVTTVDGGVQEPVPRLEAVRVQATAADLHHRAGQALRRESVDADLPRHGGRVVKGAVETVCHDVQAGIGSAGIG